MLTGITDREPARIPLIYIAVILAVVGIRFITLIVFGPSEVPDSGLSILQSNCILGTVSTPVCGTVAFKSTGYGYVIAAFKIVFGEQWQWSLTITQHLLSLAASAMLARAFFAFTGSLFFSVVLFTVHTLSLPLLIDQWTLRDSFNASLLTIAISLLVIAATRPSPNFIWLLFGVAGLCGLASGLREQLVYYGAFSLPLVALAAHRNWGGWKGSAAAIVIVILPVIVVQQGLRAINQQLAGVEAVSTNARTVMIQGLLDVSKRHPELFDGETPLDRVARQKFVRHVYGEVVQINTQLMRDGLSSEEIGKLAIAKYLEGWQRFPGTFSAVVVDRMTDKHIRSYPSLGQTLLYLSALKTGDDTYYSSRQTLQRALREGRPVDFVIAGISFPDALASYAIYVLAWLAFVGAIYAAWSGRANSDHKLVIVLFVAYLGVIITHCLVHIEARQVAAFSAILPFLSMKLIADRMLKSEAVSS